MFVSSRYDRAAMSEIYRLGRQGLDPREVVVERLQSRKYGKQRGLGYGFDDEVPTHSPQNGLATGQLHVARNAECLVTTVLEETNVSFGVHCALHPRHMPYICCQGDSEITTAAEGPSVAVERRLSQRHRPQEVEVLWTHRGRYILERPGLKPDTRYTDASKGTRASICLKTRFQASTSWNPSGGELVVTCDL
jgi:hypothetical protein